MKILIQILFLLFLSIQVGFAQSEQTIVRSIPLQTASTIDIDLEGELKGQQWDKDFVRVVVTIKLLNGGDEILKRLITAGRYDTEAREQDGLLIIGMPKIRQQVMLRGILLEEQFSFEVFYPQGIELNTQAKQPSL